MDTCRQNEDVNQPPPLHHHHRSSSRGSSWSGWPHLALVVGSCCSCPYLVWWHSSTQRPSKSHRNIPATIDLDGTQDLYSLLSWSTIQFNTSSLFKCEHWKLVLLGVIFNLCKIHSRLQKLPLQALFVFRNRVLSQAAVWDDSLAFYPHTRILKIRHFNLCQHWWTFSPWEVCFHRANNESSASLNKSAIRNDTTTSIICAGFWKFHPTEMIQIGPNWWFVSVAVMAT